jgi:hypothetical protein
MIWKTMRKNKAINKFKNIFYLHLILASTYMLLNQELQFKNEEIEKNTERK